MSDTERERWANTFVTAGWLFVLGYLAIVAVQVNRARNITTPSFEDGVWGERIEIVSFAAIPQQIIVLVPAAAAAVAAVLMSRDTVVDREPWLDRLVRAVAGTAILAIALGVVGGIAVAVRDRDSVGDFGDLVSRVGGIAMASAIVRVCLLAERSRHDRAG
jgi:hypothetical protein